MTCDECFEAFSASADGELPADLHDAMNEHLDECADCQRLRGRLLSLGAEMKAQPFPEPDVTAIKALSEAAMAGLQSTRWGVLRRVLRAPYESWPWRLGLRLVSFTAVTTAVALSVIVRWLLPPYRGAEAAANSGLPDATAWLSWAPAPALPLLAALAVVVLGFWTCGLPALLADLWGESRMRQRQVVSSLAGLALLGPFAALPLLSELELGSYVLACSLWAGICLVSAFVLVAVKTPRPLPRLALDFVALVLPLGILEWVARSSLALPSAADCQPAIALLVGSLPFATLTAGVGVLSLTVLLLGSGLSGMVAPYRGTGGRPLAALLLLAGLGTGFYGLTRVRPQGVVSPVRAELMEGRKAYLLASGGDNPWLLQAVTYPRLEVNVAGPGTDPRSARLRLASAYLDWNERGLLDAMTAWADHAPGVTWGLSAFVDSLGVRQGSVLALPSEERQRAVAHLLVQLRWRVLAQAVMSAERGSVSGRIEMANGQREGLKLRLIEVRAGVPEVADGLAEEIRWAGKLAGSDDLGPAFSAPYQGTALTLPDGTFEFSHLAKGRYVLAILPDQPASLTYNATIPGEIEVRDGPVKLPPIRLSAGTEGEDIPLQAKDWQSEGQVDFSVSASGPSCRLAPGASASSFVDAQLFHSGKARVKLLTEGKAGDGALLVAKMLGKDGRQISQSSRELWGYDGGLQELEISSDGREGYLQLMLYAGQGPLQVKAVKLEVLP